MKRNAFRNTSVVVICTLILIAIGCFIGVPAQADQLALEVTDFEGNVFQLQNARIFIESPVSCCSCPPKIVTFDGIEVMDASETYIIRWEVVEGMEKEYEDKDQITIFLRDGKTLSINLSDSAEQFLSGDTDPAAYRIFRIQEVKHFKVVQNEDQSPK